MRIQTMVVLSSCLVGNLAADQAVRLLWTCFSISIYAPSAALWGHIRLKLRT